ncbi:hypothetical protein ACE6H2_000907 [Prunus campanulata]
MKLRSLWQMTYGSMPGMLEGDHANTYLLFGRKMVSTNFSFTLSLEPICAFLLGLSRSRVISSASYSGLHPSSVEDSRHTPSS